MKAADGKANLRTLVIHIPRTAGSSTWFALSRGWYKQYPTRKKQYIYDIEQVIADFSKSISLTTFTHLSVPLLLDRGIITQEWLDTQWTFTFVRNTWERLVSVWRHRTSLQGHHPRFAIPWDVPREFSVYIDQLPYIAPIGIYNYRLPLSDANRQCSWLQSNDGRWLVDFIGRYENLENDWRIISEVVGITEPLPDSKRQVARKFKPRKSSPGIHAKLPVIPFRDLYDEHTRQVVAQLYSDEIELFGYTFE